MSTVPLHDAGDSELAVRVAHDIDSVGVSAASGVLDGNNVHMLRSLVDHAVDADQRWHRPGERAEELGRVVFLPRYGREVLDLLESGPLMDVCDELLGSTCILYTMTTLCQAPHGPGRGVHVDISDAVPGFLVGLGAMVLLDDFTLAAGPTRFHPDVTVDPPSQQDFENRSLRLEAPAGSVCWFHGRIWHDALPNTTGAWRRAILLALVRPYVRQRFDMPRIVDRYVDEGSLTPQIRQKLGFGLVPPESYEEYFLPEETRKQLLLERSLRESRAARSAGTTQVTSHLAE